MFVDSRAGWYIVSCILLVKLDARLDLVQLDAQLGGGDLVANILDVGLLLTDGLVGVILCGGPCS